MTPASAFVRTFNWRRSIEMLLEYARRILLGSFVQQRKESTPPVALCVENALKTLREFDPRVAQIVELRFLDGFSVDEAAARLQLPRETAKRDWVFGNAWLKVEVRRQLRRAA